MTKRGSKTRHPGVYKQKNGGWVIQAVIRQDGQYHTLQRTLPASATVREAVTARAALVDELRDKVAAMEEVGAELEVVPMGPTGTVADYAERWIERKAGGELRMKVAEDYATILSRRVLPRLGHVEVADLQRWHVLDWRQWAETRRRKDGSRYGKATLALWWRVMRSMLNDLICDHDLHPNLTFRIRPPAGGADRRRVEVALTAEQLAGLLAAVQTQYSDWYAEVYTLVFSGMRPSALYALTWGDVDFDGGFILIDKSVVGGHLGRPKNNRPRKVALTDGMRAVLLAHREARTGLPGATLFPAVNGRRRDTTTLYALLKAASKQAGLPVTAGPQVLRYTHNTLLREAGVPDEIVRERLGHVSREMGHRYFKGHIEAQRLAVEGLAKVIEGGDP